KSEWSYAINIHWHTTRVTEHMMVVGARSKLSYARPRDFRLSPFMRRRDTAHQAHRFSDHANGERSQDRDGMNLYHSTSDCSLAVADLPYSLNYAFLSCCRYIHPRPPHSKGGSRRHSVCQCHESARSSIQSTY